MSQQQTRILIWQQLVEELTARIERRLASFEIDTLAFLIDQHWGSLTIEQPLLPQIIEAAIDDRPIDLLASIHERLLQLLRSTYYEIYLAGPVSEIYTSEFWLEYRRDLYQQLITSAEHCYSFAKRAQQLNEIDMPILSVPPFLVPFWAARGAYLFAAR